MIRQKSIKQRTVRHLLDEADNNRIVHVPLDDKGKKYAIVDELVFEDLIDLGLSPIWRLKRDRKRNRVVDGIEKQSTIRPLQG